MIPLFTAKVDKSVDEPLLEVLHSGYITQGPKVDEFERLLGEYLRHDKCITLNSCTSALTLALRLAGVSRGDEVITTPMTCTATNLPILNFGAKIVWADVDPNSGLIDPADVERKITPKTKAIMACDWGGMPVDSVTLRGIAEKHGIKFIEDAAHAFGAEFNGQMVGSIAHFTCFSFQAIKHLTTGDGGLLTTCCDEPYKRGRILRWFGIDRDNPGKDSRIDQDIEEWGYKYHMNDLMATIGIAQMGHIAQIVAAHQSNAEWYSQMLDPLFTRVTGPESAKSAWWIYTVLLPDQITRDKFKSYMLAKGIQVNQVHKRNDHYTVFRPFNDGPLPGTDEFADRMICLPVHSDLSRQDLTTITKAANEFARANK